MAEAIWILYVDDEQDLLDISKIFLEESGDFAVTTAISADEGIRLLEQEKFDAIVSDYQMPGMDGIQFLVEVRKRFGPIPFILFTGRGREEVVIQALNSGADFYLQKGGEPGAQFAELSHKIKAAVERKKSEVALKESEHRTRLHEERLIMAQEIGSTGSWEFNLENNEIWGSAEGLRIFGFPPVAGAFPIDDIEACIPERERVHQALVDLIGEGKEYNIEYAINPADGSAPKIIHSFARLEKDTRGNPLRLMGVIQDISGRKKGENEILFKNVILSTQQETSPDAILIVDENGKILSYNQKFIGSFGIPDELIASRLDEPVLQFVVGQLADPEAFLSRVRYLYEHKSEKSFEELLLRDGRTLERFSSPMLGETGTYYGRVWYFRDITVRKRAEFIQKVQMKLGLALQGTSRLPEALDLSLASAIEIAGMDAGGIYLVDPVDGSLDLAVSSNLGEEFVRLGSHYPSDSENARVVMAGKPLYFPYRDTGTIVTVAKEKEGLLAIGIIPIASNDQVIACLNVTSHAFDEIPVSARIALEMISSQIGTAIQRIRSEEALQKSERDLQTAQAIARLGRWELDLVHNTLHWSDGIYQLFEINPGEFRATYEAFLNYIHPDDREGVNAAYTDSLKTKKPYEISHRLRMKDGRIKWVNEICNTDYDAKGQPLRSVGIVQDITGSRQAEEALQFTRHSIDSATETLVTIAKDGHFADVNDAFCRKSGYSKEELLTMTIHDVDPDYNAEIWSEFWNKLKQSGSLTFESTHRSKDGKTYPVEITSTYFEYRGNEYQCSFARDITGRKKAEATLRNKEDYYRTILQTTKDGFWILDAHTGRFLDVNETYCKISGYSKAEILNLGISDIDSIEDPAKTQERIRRILSKGSEIFETHHRRKDGSKFAVEISVTYFPAEGGKFICFLRDITRRKQAEEALRESEEKFRTLFESMAPGVFYQKSDGALIDINPAALSMFGLSREQFMGRDSYDPRWKVVSEAGELLPPEQHPSMIALRSGKPVKDLIVGVYNPQTEVITWMSTNAEPQFRNGEATPYQVFVTMYDITGRKLAEEALRESEERFRGIYDTISSGVAIYEVKNDGAYGKDYIIKDFNKTALAIEGKKKDEVVGKSLFDLRPAIDEYGLIPVFQQVWKTGVPAYFPQKVYIDEKYTSWYENRVFRLQSGEIVAVYDDVTERKRMEEIRKAYESRLNSAMDIGSLAWWEMDLPDGAVRFDDRKASILGYSPDQFHHYRDFTGLLHPDDLEPAMQAMRDHIEGKEARYHTDYRIRAAAGDYRWFQDVGGITKRHPDGSPSTVTGIVIDITARKVAEEKLRLSEQRLSLTLEATSDGLWDWDLKNDTVFWSPRAYEMLGYAMAEFPVTFAVWKSLIHPDEVDATERNVLAQLKEGQRFSAEFRYRMKDGSWKWILGRGRAVEWDTGGNAIRMVGTHMDLTGLKEAELAVKESEERFKSYIDNSPEGVFISDERGYYIEVNPGACRITGYEKEELLAMHISDTLPPESTEAGLKHFKELIEYGHAFGELLFRHKDGSLRYWSVDAVRLTPTRFIGFVKDITDRKVAEESLRVANKKLNLLSGITRHDISNQITVLVGYLRMLEKKQSDPSFTEYFLKINAAAQRISSMIQFTREYESIGVNAPVWQNCRTLADTAAKEAPLGQVIVKNDLPSGAEVFADPLIVKVFYNLIDNAIRYGDTITTIRFSEEERNGNQIIVCEDDGGGIVAA